MLKCVGSGNNSNNLISTNNVEEPIDILESQLAEIERRIAKLFEDEYYTEEVEGIKFESY